METICAIISGGVCSAFTELDRAVFIIACDKGYAYAQAQNVRPDLLVGDFDSFRGSVDPSIPLLRFPKEKDDTDTMLAVRYAVSHDFKHIYLYCALGGRLDHLYANLQAAAFAASHGLQVRIFSDTEELFVFSSASLTLAPREGWSLSVFSMTDTCQDVCISGAKYSLQHTSLTNHFPIGASNAWDGTVTISVDEGILLVMLCKLPPSEQPA